MVNEPLSYLLYQIHSIRQMHCLKDQFVVFAAREPLSNNLQSACPACEYRQGGSGRPVLKDGTMHCLECGNSWKEFSSVTFGAKPMVLHNNSESAAEPDDVSINSHNSTASYRLADKTPKSGIVPTVLASLLLVAGVTAVVVFLQSGLKVGEPEGLHVAELNFEELVRGNQGKVVRVKGTISNDGPGSETVGRLAIVLRKSNGSELTRWYYNSPIRKLSPGGKTRFVSSIQYDTPVIASVEASFE